jgi:hypothetical protein
MMYFDFLYSIQKVKTNSKSNLLPGRQRERAAQAHELEGGIGNSHERQVDT